MSFHTRVYSATLHLLPHDLRKRFESEMVTLFEHRMGEARHAAEKLVIFVQAIVDVLAQAITTRFRRRSSYRYGRASDSSLEGVIGDVRLGSRRLLARPRFSFVAILVLGLGVGLTTTMFSVVDMLLLRDLPYPNAEELYALRQATERDGSVSEGISLANVSELSRAWGSAAFVGGAEGPHGLRLFEDGRASSLRTWLVTNEFFPALDIEPVLGRSFLSEEFVPGNEQVVLLSYDLWAARYDADPGIIGRELILDDEPHRVVGVLPSQFGYPSKAELWAPRPVQQADLTPEGRRRSDAIGVVRLGGSSSLEGASGELDEIALRLASTFPESNAGTDFTIAPLREDLYGDLRSPVLMLSGAAILVLLIAASNVGGLQIAQGMTRTREYALRSALGGRAGRLLRLVCMESLVLGTLGGAVGVGLALVGIEVIASLAPWGDVSGMENVGLNQTSMFVGLAVAIGSALIAGLAPALRAAREDPNNALGEAGRASTSGKHANVLRDGLVIGQIALALVLTTGAGLLGRSFIRVQGNDLGFQPGGRLAAQVWAYNESHQPDLEFFTEAAEELRRCPGVLAVGLTTDLPQANDATVLRRPIALTYSLDGLLPTMSGGSEAVVRYSAVDHGYFDAMGIPVRTGRGFTDLDTSLADPVAIVNEAFARRHSEGRDVVGRRITLRAGATRERRIVGVVPDVRRQGLEASPVPEVYVPLTQSPSNGLTFVINTEDRAEAMISAIREALWSVDPRQAVWAIHPIADLLADWNEERRFTTIVLTGFSAFALLLAGIGIYGLVSFAVKQRTREVAIRRAIGGQQAEMLRMIVRQGTGLAGVGIAIGLPAALVTSFLIRGMLYGVGPMDLHTLVAASALIASVVLIAVLIPAARAMTIEPTQALRVE